MKDFEFDKMSEQNDQQNEQTQEERTDAVNQGEINKPATDAANAEQSNHSTNSVGNDKHAEQQTQDQQMKQNPYFQGYSQHTPSQSPYTHHQPMNEQQAPSAPQYQQNPNWREYPYGNQQNPKQSNPYQNNGGTNPYTQQHSNGFAPQYHSPEQNGGQISYKPSENRKKKEKKPVTRAAVAVACCLTLLFSAGAGFGGAMLANRMYSENGSNAVVGTQTPHAVTSADPVVIYKSVENVATSTGSIGENLTYSQVAEMVRDSVVEIVTEFNNQSMWYQYVTQGAGSGVIISEDGYIITNAHVITNESTGSVADNIVVRLTDATEYSAQIIAYDADADIAILKIEAKGLTPAQCGNSDQLAVGEELVVVGNPLGELGGTVTNGIVSATQREIQMGGVTMSLIQTNAAVNPGNSGGGMFNMKGQLVGIVNAKSSGSGIEGLGFAIPINYALDVSEQLLEFGYVRGKTMIGVSFQDVSNSNYYYYYNIKSGVYVAELTPGYNDKALKVGDRVIAVNGKEISSSQDIKAVVTSCSVGDKITFQLYRNDQLMEVEVTCYEKVPDTQTDVQFEEEKKSDAVKEDENATELPEDEGVFSISPFSGGLEEFFFGSGR